MSKLYAICFDAVTISPLHITYSKDIYFVVFISLTTCARHLEEYIMWMLQHPMRRLFLVMVNGVIWFLASNWLLPKVFMNKPPSCLSLDLLQKDGVQALLSSWSCVVVMIFLCCFCWIVLFYLSVFQVRYRTDFWTCILTAKPTILLYSSLGLAQRIPNIFLWGKVFWSL